ncbi:MAG: SpoIIE family protein phosphatase [Paracoccus sp. (in: a-proteobacteria)]|nr:SpoIIE family protein phosphatase [Paracoccus sp. (in: a-proteobacteria)]
MRYSGGMVIANRTPLAADPAPVLPRLVLVVDASAAQRRLLSIFLTRAGYSVIEACDGPRALEICARRQPDFVLSDWLMPGMTGVELCRHIRENCTGGHVYFILLTSRAGPDDIAFGLENGADDFLTKPAVAAELLARLRAGERLLRLQDDALRANARLSEALAALRGAQTAMDRDLQEARRLQQGLIGERAARFGDFAVANLLQPAGHVGGDLTGSFAISGRRFGVFAIDVAGHGVAAALLTARLATQFSASVDQNAVLFLNDLGLYDGRSPAELARYLNYLMLADLRTDAYFTMVYAEIDQMTGDGRLVQAGHPHPVVQRGDGRIERIGDGGLPIGVIEDPSFDEIRFHLDPGDRLLIVSDGVCDASDRAGRRLGQGGLADILRKNEMTPGIGLLEALKWSVLGFAGARQGDDISAVLVERDEGAA